MDHIKPLIEAKGDITYWHLENCTTLCHQCHKKKTGSEASARAAARAIQKQQMGTTGTKPKKGRTKPRPGKRGYKNPEATDNPMPPPR